MCGGGRKRARTVFYWRIVTYSPGTDKMKIKLRIQSYELHILYYDIIREFVLQKTGSYVTSSTQGNSSNTTRQEDRNHYLMIYFSHHDWSIS